MILIKQYIRLAITLVCIVCCNMLVAQKSYVFRQLGVFDGLSDNQIQSLNMTGDGRLTVRTNTMINIYNSATITCLPYNTNIIPYSEYAGMYQEYFDNENRIWLKNRGMMWCLDLNTDKFIYDIKDIVGQFGIEGSVKDLYIDGYKNYWFFSGDGNIFYYKIAEKQLVKISKQELNVAPRKMVQYKNLNWILYDNGMLKCWNTDNQNFTYSEPRFLSVGIEALERVELCATPDGNLWIMYNQGVLFYNTATHDVTRINNINLVGNDLLTAMDIDQQGYLWLGSSKSGVRIINCKTFEINHLPNMPLLTGGVITHSTDISDIFVDKDNGVWIGTTHEGVLYYHENMNRFEVISRDNIGATMLDDNIKCMVEDSDGTILLGTVKGLLRYDPQRKRVSVAYPELANELCIGLYRDRSDIIWVGTFQNGAFSLDRGKVRHYDYPVSSPVHISYYNLKPNFNSIRSFYEDDYGDFWISVYGGIAKLDRDTGKITLLSESFDQIKQYMFVRNICPVDDGLLVVAGDNGLFCYSPQKNEITIPKIKIANDDIDIGTTKYNCTLFDSRQILWLGSSAGLLAWDRRSDKITKIGLKSDLYDSILGIIEDKNGNVWVSTSKGISRLVVEQTGDRIECTIANFDKADGVQRGAFFENSAILARCGSIYFGGTHGANMILSEQTAISRKNDKPYFTALKLSNTTIKTDEKYNRRVVLNKPINQTKEITLKYNETFITLEFSGLNFINPHQTAYKYKLENFDENWTEIHPENGLGFATYTLLNPGRYKFMVQSANNNQWSEQNAELVIVVKPPFWATAFAMILYIAIVIVMCYVMASRWVRHKQKRMLFAQREESLRQKEKLDQLKLRFFTNVSHELRTPLTLIITPLEIIIKRLEDNVLKPKLMSIYKNAQQLLDLVNQLLDLRKLEMKGESLNLSKSNIIEFIDEIYRSFSDIAQGQMINYDFIYDTPDLMIHFDRIKVKKIVNNILSNAFKFTANGGSVIMKAHTTKRIVENQNREFLIIEIKDTGIGIEQSKIDKIFERFYQLHTDANKDNTLGSGIGLHLIKEYVLLHGGQIAVQSSVGVGSTFSVYIPTDLAPELTSTEEQKALNAVQTVEESVYDTEQEISKFKILLVEDNDEFRSYLSQELGHENYAIVEASNGEQGLKMAKKSHPDLIVSDVMMPIMDGIEMCNTLKNDINTSHIPIVLLTARDSDQARISGYDAGADSYISKPFNLEMLLLRIRKLIEQQRKRQEVFVKTIDVNPSTITITSIDEVLIQKALECVENNIDNPDFSVEELSSSLCMHRMNLYRKLVSIVGQTPTEFIRTIRLKRAAQLLQDTDMNITEIGEIIGFNTPKYFTKHFKDNFGMTPSQYADQYRKGRTVDRIE